MSAKQRPNPEPERAGVKNVETAVVTGARYNVLPRRPKPVCGRWVSAARQAKSGRHEQKNRVTWKGDELKEYKVAGQAR